MQFQGIKTAPTVIVLQTRDREFAETEFKSRKFASLPKPRVCRYFSRHRRRNSLLGNDEKSGAVGRQTNHNPYSTQMFFFQTHGLDNSTQQLYSESLSDIKSSESTSEDSREHPRRTFQTFLLPRLNVNQVRLLLQV